MTGHAHADDEEVDLGVRRHLGEAVEGSLGALADADLVIEAVFDDLAVKTELFRKLDAIVRPDAILATNTSYLDPDKIAAATAHPIVGARTPGEAQEVSTLSKAIAARQQSS